MDIKLFVATKAFIVKDGKVLILRESQKYEDGTNAAHFDLPGGRLAPGEHFAEALAREVKEETGLSVTLLVDQLQSVSGDQLCAASTGTS